MTLQCSHFYTLFMLQLLVINVDHPRGTTRGPLAMAFCFANLQFLQLCNLLICFEIYALPNTSLMRCMGVAAG